jgi:spore germination protein KB
MNKEVISDRQGIMLLILYLMGSTVLVGSGGAAKKDMWLAMIIAILLSVPLFLFYSKLLSSFPGKNIFDITELAFGKLIGKIIILLYTWYAIHLGAMVVDNYGEFINIVGLPETPRAVPVMFFGVICAWVVKEGIEVLGRWAELFLAFILGVMFITIFFAIPKMNINRILPVLEDGLPPLIKGTIGIFAFPYAEAVTFTMISPFYKNKKSIYKIYMYGLLWGGVMLILIALRNLLTLGPSKILMHYYPSYIAVGVISIGDFIQRAQILITVAFLITGFAKISVCLLAAANGVAKLFNINEYRNIVVPVTILMINLSFIVYDNIMQTIKWAPNIYAYYAFIFQVILPVITYICASLKIRKSANIEQSNQ